MSVDVHVQHLHELAFREFAPDHVTIGDGYAEPVDSGLDRVVEQIEFIATAGVDVFDAGGFQPMLPGQIALIGAREHVQQRELIQIDGRAACLACEQRGGADGDVPFIHQQAVVDAFPLAVAEADGAVEHARFGEIVVDAGRQAEFEMRMRVTQTSETRHQPAAREGGWRVDTQAVAVGFLLQAADREFDSVEGLL